MRALRRPQSRPGWCGHGRDNLWYIATGHGSGCSRVCQACWVSASPDQRHEWQAIWYAEDTNPSTHRDVDDMLDCIRYPVVPPMCDLPPVERAAAWDEWYPGVTPEEWSK